MINDQTAVQNLIALVIEDYVPDSPTHDHSHLGRVANLARKICRAEGGNVLVVACAAWLHDLHRQAGGDFFVPPEDMDERAQALMVSAAIPEAFHAPILNAAHYTDRYSFSDRLPFEASIESRAVRDADILDAIGAIGIARAFTFGGAYNIPLWVDSPSTEPVALDVYVQSRRPASTLHHFHEKLLRLPLELETPTAIELARRRSGYMTRFVEEFTQEWYNDFS
jgi:uncharacterized protein